MQNETDTTHFGFDEVRLEDKESRVRDVFDSVASRYDLMNDLMSLGSHRWWKRFTLGNCGLRPGQCALDVAGGTGDIARHLKHWVGDTGTVVLSDINANMLEHGRDRAIDSGDFNRLHYVQSDAEQLPFADDLFHCVTVAFGLRNMTDKAAALASMHRVTKPGGRLLVLEFSKPVLPLLDKLYSLYSFRCLPWLGQLVAGDASSYRYLVESIRMHPDQMTLKQMLVDAGFERVEYFNLLGGIVALHRGFKF